MLPPPRKCPFLCMGGMGYAVSKPPEELGTDTGTQLSRAAATHEEGLDRAIYGKIDCCKGEGYNVAAAILLQGKKAYGSSCGICCCPHSTSTAVAAGARNLLAGVALFRCSVATQHAERSSRNGQLPSSAHSTYMICSRTLYVAGLLQTTGCAG